MGSKKKVKKEPSQKDIVKTIRGIWESLDSHLDSSIPGEIKDKCKYCGGRKFHRDCCVEYAQMILDLTKLL